MNYFKYLLVSLLFMSYSLAQEGVSYNAGVLMMKLQNPVTNITNQNGIAQINESWFDNLATQYSISELKPIFQNDFEEMELYYYIEFPNTNTVQTVQNSFDLENEVTSTQKNYYGEYSSTPNDEYYNEQWNLLRIEAPIAWNEVSGNSSVIVAVLDTGIDFGNGSTSDIHPDLISNIWNENGKYGYNYYEPTTFPADDNGHGTHVAGTIGALTNNMIGIAGVAGGDSYGNAGIRILPIKISEPYSRPTLLWAQKAIEWATDKKADIINMSWSFNSQGSDPNCSGDPEQGSTEPFRELQIVINYAYSQDVVLVAALKNSGIDETSVDCTTNWRASRPAYFFNNVISVVARNQGDRKVNLSAYASYISISAPGDNIISTDIRSTYPSGYNTRGGNSMATAMVSGLAALIKSYAPSSDNEMIRKIIENTTDYIDDINYNYMGKMGSGRINANSAITLLKNVPANPTNINLQNVNNKPYITWEANTEADLKQYKVHITYEERTGPSSRFWTYSYATHYTTETDFTDNSFLIGSGNTFAYYKVAAIDILDNSSLYSPSVSTSGGLFKEGEIGADAMNLPMTNSLNTNYPNPFNPTTTIPFEIKEGSKVKLLIYNSRGELINTLVNNFLSEGDYNYKWNSITTNGNKVSSGIYYYKLVITGLNSVKS